MGVNCGIQSETPLKGVASEYSPGDKTPSIFGVAPRYAFNWRGNVAGVKRKREGKGEKGAH